MNKDYGMENKDFDKAIEFVLRWEGFISNDPEDLDLKNGDKVSVFAQDPGGLTIWGISERSHKEAVWKMYRLIKEGKKNEAFKIAKNIYYQTYWLKSNCDNFSFPLNLIIFDTAVNTGRRRAKEFYVSSLDWRDYLLRRIAFYSKLSTAKFYIRGWINRVVSLYEICKEKVDEHNI